MKSVTLLALCFLSSPLLAQVGAKVDQIVIPKSFGTSLVLKHCEALELKGDDIKVKHDDGSYVVPFGNLPQPWKKWIASRKAAADATEKKEMDQALKNAKPFGNDNSHWKTTPPPEGWEILRVRVISEWAGALLADQLQSAPSGTPGAAVSYNSSGKTIVLSGILPKDSEDNQMYTVLAKKGDIRKFQDKELQSYLVSRFEKGVAP